MKEISGEIKGKISFEKIVLNNIEFNKIYQRRVTRSNDTSGKINVPADFIGLEVIVAIPKKKLKGRRNNAQIRL